MPAVRPRRFVLPVAAALGLSGAVLVASPAAAAVFPVTTEAELIIAINGSNALPGADVITIEAGITLTANLPQITDTLTVEGQGNTITAGGYDVFTASATSLTVRDVIITSPTQGLEMANGTLIAENVQVSDASSGGIGATESNVLVVDALVTGSGMPNLAIANSLDVVTSIEVRDSEFSDGDTSGVDITQAGSGTVLIDNVEAHDNGDFGIELTLVDTATGTATNSSATGHPNYGIMFAAVDDTHLEFDDVDGDANNGGGRVIVRDTAEVISTGSGPTSNTAPGWFIESYGTGTTTSFSSVLATLNNTGMVFEPQDGATITVTNALIQGGGVGMSIPIPFLSPPAEGAVIATGVEIVESDTNGVVIPGGASADVTFIDSTIHGVDTTEDGAAIRAELDGATLTLDRSTIYDNVTTGSGGGVYAIGDEESALVVVNSTIADNSAESVGGILADLAGTVDVSHSTIVGNTAAADSSSVSLSSELAANLTNTIVDGGDAALITDSADTLTVDYSLVRTVGASAAAAVDAGNNLTGLDPRLDPLADNGGPTLTMLPRTGSPVLNAGDPAFVAPPATDQRGEARVQGGRLDIGSVEVPGALAATGTDLGAVAPAALLLLLGGAVLLAARRRTAR